MTAIQEAFKQAYANKMLDQASEVFKANPDVQVVKLDESTKKWIPDQTITIGVINE